MEKEALQEEGTRVTEVTNVAESGKRKLELAACESLPCEIMESGVPRHVFERMDFLWRASHSLRVSSPSISRMYSDQLRKLFAEQGPGAGSLSDWVSDTICTSCGGVLTPGITCRVRLKHRSLKSPSVKKAAKSKRMKKLQNELVMTCALCGEINVRPGAERRVHHRRRCKGNSVDSARPEEAERAADAVSSKPRVKGALRGSFIPLGGSFSAPLGPSRRRPSSVVKPGTAWPKTVDPSVRKSSGHRRSSAGEESLRGRRGLSPRGFSSERKKSRTKSDRGGAESSAPGSRSSSDVVAVEKRRGGDNGRTCSKAGGGEPLSLLERIRMDAKKKRQREKAADLARSKSTLDG